MLRAEKRVLPFTWTVVREVFRLTRRNVPDAPAAPHAPSADERFTATTNPYALTERGADVALAVDALTATIPMTNTAIAIARVVRSTAVLPLETRQGDANLRVARAAALPQTAPSRK